MEVGVFHGRTKELLAMPEPVEPRVSSPLAQWAAEHDVTVPRAVSEWAALGGSRLSRRYSNQDWFSFEEPELVDTVQGLGLLFCVENQGNFGKVALLDHGDDPPVLFGWLQEEPWVPHADRFSDCVHEQIFDWQYMLEFDPADPDDREIAFAPTIELPGPPPLNVLRSRFLEHPHTRYEIEGVGYESFRFSAHPKLRMTVQVEQGKDTVITITGPDHEELHATQADLRGLLAEHS